MITMEELADMEVGEEIIDEQQQSRDAWLRQRLGKITASNFGKLAGTGKRKDQEFTQVGYAYLHMCIAERLGSWHEASALSMQWGTENESVAFDAYAATHAGLQVTSTTYFAFNDDIGGTPDGLVGDDGCLEVKCPYNPAVHVNTLLTGEVPKEYRHQVHGHMLNTGRQWCDFVSFDPRMTGPERLVIIRIHRDEAVIRTLTERLLLAARYVNETCDRIRQAVTL